MDHTEVLAQFDAELRRGFVDDTPGTRVERVGDVVRATAPDWNGVLWSDLDEGTADAAIAAETAHFDALGRDFEWKLYSHDRPADLAGRLLAAGFVPEPEETLMVAEIAELPTEAPLPDGVRIDDVSDAAGVRLMTQVNELAFGRVHAEMERQLLRQLGSDTTVMAVAVAGEVPVCSARMDLHVGTGFASLWGGGTHPEWRGRGIYRALVAHRAKIAAERGYRYLQVDASDQSRPILERLGFRVLSTTTPYVWTAAGGRSAG
ncbi:GNAT family N-acetyltransferase [Streptomyces sp. NPDC047315]|uniref:GNAT family N-acetyltransferase n=1 Tax=Streptomyces sp. NPDC047315 TaxID=3155142 RepID=UPI0033EE81E8